MYDGPMTDFGRQWKLSPEVGYFSSAAFPEMSHFSEGGSSTYTDTKTLQLAIIIISVACTVLACITAWYAVRVFCQKGYFPRIPPTASRVVIGVIIFLWVACTALLLAQLLRAGTQEKAIEGLKTVSVDMNAWLDDVQKKIRASGKDYRQFGSATSAKLVAENMEPVMAWVVLEVTESYYNATGSIADELELSEIPSADWVIDFMISTWTTAISILEATVALLVIVLAMICVSAYFQYHTGDSRRELRFSGECCGAWTFQVLAITLLALMAVVAGVLAVGSQAMHRVCVDPSHSMSDVIPSNSDSKVARYILSCHGSPEVYHCENPLAPDIERMRNTTQAIRLLWDQLVANETVAEALSDSRLLLLASEANLRALLNGTIDCLEASKPATRATETLCNGIGAWLSVAAITTLTGFIVAVVMLVLVRLIGDQTSFPSEAQAQLLELDSMDSSDSSDSDPGYTTLQTYAPPYRSIRPRNR